jgi:glycosyltransferase involved in cell wall biosynthesis
MTRVAMVARWGLACGIDDYVRELIAAADPDVEVAVFANREPGATDAGASRVLRDWDAGSADVSRISRDLAEFDPAVVHIQFHWGYLDLGFFREVLRWCEERSVHSIVQVHSTQGHPAVGTLADIAQDLRSASVVIAHGAVDVTRLGEVDVRDNVLQWRLGEKAWPARDPDAVRESLGVGTRHPIVATFGFLQPRKQTLEVVRAVARLRRTFPQVLLIAATALHPRGFDSNYYLDVRQEIRLLGLEDSVALIVRYLDAAAAMLLLQAADVIVLPYANSSEGTSAAAKFCSAAGRPMIVSSESLFNDFRGSTFTVDRVGPESIAEAICSILNDHDRAVGLATKARLKAETLSWVLVGAEYSTLIRRLASGERHPSFAPHRL